MKTVELNCNSHCVRLRVKVRWRFGNDSFAEIWTFWVSHGLGHFSLKIARSPLVVFRVCSVISVVVDPILSQLPTSRPTPHLTPSKSRSAEHFSAPASQRVLGGEIVWSSGRRKGLVESGMEQPPLQFSTYLSSFSHGLSQYPIMRPVCLCP